MAIFHQLSPSQGLNCLGNLFSSGNAFIGGEKTQDRNRCASFGCGIKLVMSIEQIIR
jgi:hypothetical protein